MSSLDSVSKQLLYIDPGTQAARSLKTRKTKDWNNARLVEKIAAQPQFVWLTNEQSLDLLDQQAPEFGNQAVVQLVAYNIVRRDAHDLHSAGGAPDGAAYRAWIDRLSNIVRRFHTIVILEPDAVCTLDALHEAQQHERIVAFAVCARTSFAPNGLIHLHT